MTDKTPKLAVFWGDNRTLLSHKERRKLLQNAILESITPSEVLLRERTSGRLIVVTSSDEKGLFCALCKSDLVREHYGKECPLFAQCLGKGAHIGEPA